MSRRKKLGKKLTAHMATMNAGLVAHLRGANGTDTAVRVSADDAAISADALANSEFARSVKARPRHNEEGIHRVCGLLLAKLNQSGESWKNLRCPEDRASDVDCTAENDDSAVLQMQVTRAESSKSFWREIARGSVTAGQRSENVAAQDLKDAIWAKSALATSQKKQLFLVLDATESPDLAFIQIVDSFRAIHGAWAKSLGFRGIWIVGPAESLIHRLDG